MTWVTVKDFDQDVKLGDKVNHPDFGDGEPEIVLWIGKTEFLRSDPDDEAVLDDKTDYGWQVWREKKRWMASQDSEYWFVNINLNVCDRPKKDLRSPFDKDQYDSLNYFRTKEQAQEYAEECKKVAERLHEKFGE